MSLTPTSTAGHQSLFKDYRPKHFLWEMTDHDRVATIRLNRPERKTPVTFEMYAELRDLFCDLADASDIRAVVLMGVGGNFFSACGVSENIAPLGDLAVADLIAFTRMSGDLVKAMMKCPQPIIAAVDGVCAGVEAILATACNMRLATPEAKTAFRFTHVGLAGAGTSAFGMLPRIIGQGRAAELLFTGRSMSAREGLAWGFYNALHEADEVEAVAVKLAHSLVARNYGAAILQSSLSDPPHSAKTAAFY